MFKTKRSTSNFKKVFYKHEYNKKINKFISIYLKQKSQNLSIFFIFKPLKMFNGCRPLKKKRKKGFRHNISI